MSEINSKYSELLTIFAIVLTVEYSSEVHDIWDIFVGIVIILVINKYYNLLEIKLKRDDLLRFLISIIISLGTTTIVSSLLVMFKTNIYLQLFYSIVTKPLCIVLTYKFVFFLASSAIIFSYFTYNLDNNQK